MSDKKLTYSITFKYVSESKSLLQSAYSFKKIYNTDLLFRKGDTKNSSVLENVSKRNMNL